MRRIFVHVIIPVLCTFKLNNKTMSERTLNAKLDLKGKAGVVGMTESYSLAFWAIVSPA